MADKKQDQPADSQPAAAAAQQVPSESGAAAKNPVDLGTDLDKLPAVPGAGQFMSADDATEDVAPVPSAEATQTKRG